MPWKKTDTHPTIEASQDLPPDEVLFGRTALMSSLRKRAEKICGANIPVLVQGPAGSGKELLARWLHTRSSSSTGRFVKVNCAAIPTKLLESELFGYEKGAFTGANASKPGRVELADKGTLFLDEIGDLDLALQSKLLHFVQDGRFSRIGDEVERSVETRLVCSTSKDLEQEIVAQRFRSDLFYRISVVQLRMPGLTERREDIPTLCEYLRTEFERDFAMKSEPLAIPLMNYLMNQRWPGNVRQLSNEIARHVLIGPEAAGGAEHLPQRSSVAGTSPASGAVPLKNIAKDAIRDMERNVILDVLRNNQWNRRKAAQELKISYRALIYKIRNSGLIQNVTRRASAGETVRGIVNRESAASTD